MGRRQSDGSTVSLNPLGSRATARTSGREGWGARGMDEHRDNAEHAEPLLAHIEPWRRGNNVPPKPAGIDERVRLPWLDAAPAYDDASERVT
jgi:hypothetical protein